MTVQIIKGDCREILRDMAAESVHCVVTSPPYWGLRDYGIEGQLGLEPDFQMYVEHMVEVFREVRRVLCKDGTLWLNLGDSYANDGKFGGETSGKQAYLDDNNRKRAGREKRHTGLKPKDLCGIPWRVAFALQADGWYLRQDIIWSKPNPMPESVTDRCTKAHEYMFLLSKSERYFYDQDAIMEPVTASTIERLSQPTLGQQEGSWRVPGKTNGPMKAALPKRSGNKMRKPAGLRGIPGASILDPNGGVAGSIPWKGLTRNKRSVWEVTTQPFFEAHFATFPPALIEPCILAGCPKGGTVLDPFAGAGTTGLVADRLGRNVVLMELNPEYATMAERRICNDAPLFADVRKSAEAAMIKRG